MAKPSLNYYQALHVGKVKTDVIQFTTIQSAIDAITDNLTTKRYAVYVHPGTYTEKVIMEDYVDLIAIGGWAETVIAFTATVNDEPTVTGELSLIKGFTISSTGGALRARCVQAATAGFAIEDCALQVVSTAAAAVALNASASCTVTDCAIDIAATAATAALFTTGAATYTVNDSVFGGATDSIQVTTTPTLNLIGCTVSNNFNQDGGTVVVVRCQMKSLAFGTAICTFTAELSRFTAGVATADAFAHVITCAKCSFNGQNFNNAATVATTIVLRDCDGIATLTNAGVGGTLTLYDCGVETLTTSQGTVVAYGGRINACGGSTGTSFVWWLNSDKLRVIANMKIANALAVAAAPDSIEIGGGTYLESNLALVTGIDIIGAGTPTLISANDANPVFSAGNVVATVKNMLITQAGAGTCLTVNNAGANVTLFAVVLTAKVGENAVAMTAGTCNLSVVRIAEGDIDLSGGVCTLNMDLCQWAGSGDIDAGGAFAHVISMSYCSMGGRSIVNIATGATVIDIRYCSLIDILSDAGLVGTMFIENSTIITATKVGTSPWTVYLARFGTLSNNNAAGGISVYGGHINACGGSVGSVVFNQPEGNMWTVISGMKIAHSLAVAGAGDTIRIMPGTYAESNLNLVAGVDLVGTDPDQCVIETGDAGQAILNAAVTCSISNLTVSNTNAGHPAIEVTANTLTVRNCLVRGTGAGDAIAMLAGTLNAYDATVGAGHIDLSTAPCTLSMYRCRITTNQIDTAGAFVHVLTFEHCDFGGQSLISAATAATTLAMRSCSNVGTITNAGTGAFSIAESNAGAVNNNNIATMTISDSTLGAVTQAALAGTINITNCSMAAITTGGTGTIRLNGGCLFTDIAANAGVLTWKTALKEWRVVDGTADMKIMDAADAAAAGDTILIGPGTFTEALDLDAAGNACTYKGFGIDKTIITQVAGTTVLVDGITNVVLEDLTINLTVGVNGNAALKLDAATVATASVILRNVVINATWNAGTVYGVLVVDDGAKVASLGAYACKITCTGGAISYAVAANTCTTATSAISLYGCILNGANYDIYNDRITISTHKCELNGAGWWIQNNATAIGLAMGNEDPATVTPVTFAGAAGEFADLTGAELYTCLATVLIGEVVYISAANTVAEATNAVGAPLPAEGVVIYKPAGAAGTTCYVKNLGMAYMATPPAVWVAGTNVWLGVAGGQLVARPTNALKQVLGVGVDGKRMLINITSVEVVTDFVNIPIAWGAGSAPTGTHTDGNSRRAVAIATPAQTVFSQAVDIPEGFLAFSKLYARLFPTVPTLTAMAGAHIYDDGIGYVDETIPSNNVAASDMNLFPAVSALVPAVNDAYFFGAARRFSQFDINIGTQGVKAPGDWTIAWEYSKGGGVWGTLTGVVDGTVEFTAAVGVRTVSFIVPTDWATDTVNAVLAYYVRARIATVTTPIGTRPLGTQSWTNDGTYDWTAYSSAASDDQDEATHSDTATADGVATTEDLIEDLDISGAADAYTMVEKDCFSVELIVDVLTNTTQLNVLGFRLEYSAQRGA